MASAHFFHYHNIYADLQLPAIIIAGCSVSVALTLSLILIFQHLRWYTKPSEQKWIVAVIFIVPVYATDAILSLWNLNLSLTFDILRSCYEAFALYAFGSYLIACLGGDLAVRNFLQDGARKEINKPLLEQKRNSDLEQNECCNFILRPRVLGEHLFEIIKFGLVQYMILKTLCAFLAFVLELCGIYGDGEFKWYYGYPYLTIVLNFSQMWALYCLVQFYHTTHQRLEAIKPFAKFISFKAIVFATWWQGVAIVLLCNYGVLPKERKFQTGLQEFLICIEMGIAAVAHIYIFSAKQYCTAPSLSGHARPTFQETSATLKIKEGDQGKPAALQKKETEANSPGTSVKESVQDIVVKGGHEVVKDVVLTIHQVVEPVHDGVTKIQHKFHHILESKDSKDKPGVEDGEDEHMKNVKKAR